MPEHDMDYRSCCAYTRIHTIPAQFLPNEMVKMFNATQNEDTEHVNKKQKHEKNDINRNEKELCVCTRRDSTRLMSFPEHFAQSCKLQYSLVQNVICYSSFVVCFSPFRNS